MIIKILGVKINVIDIEQTLSFIKETINSEKQAQIATVNPEFLVEATYDPEFKKILNSCDLNTCDGFGIKLIAKIFYGIDIKRTTGVEITEKLLKSEYKLFLLGGANGIVEKVAKNFPQAKILGLDSGGKMIKVNNSWCLERNETIIEKIKSSGAEILLLALQYNKQEKWIAENLKKLPNIKVAIGVGGTFDYLSGNIKRAPTWLRKIGLEWLFRLIFQPKRWRRIIKATIIFPILVIKENISKNMFNLFKPKVRTRYAPSPTGYLHIGGLRTALYSYLFAKQNKGTFFLRIEDTDQTREVKGAVENLIKSLNLTGIKPDEGVIIKKEGKIGEIGRFGPYIQSQRLDIYRKYAQKLIDLDKAYYCFCSSERLNTLRQAQEAAKKPTRYDGLCRSLSPQEIKNKLNRGDKYVIRMKVNPEEDGIIEFEDLVRGKISIHSKEIDDQILIKTDGFPTYHLAHVVDDHLMQTTHIVRGEEWLPSTPKHILLFKFFGWQPPIYGHLSLILNPDRSKLSKRQGDVAVEDYLAKGYLPEALVNYVALLGWNPGTEQEIFSMKELIKEFSFDKIHKAGAIFDIKKLDWMNSEYIKKLSASKFKELALPYLQKKFVDKLSDIDIDKIMNLEQQRINRLDKIGEGLEFIFIDEINYDKKLLAWKKSTLEQAKECLKIVLSVLEKCNNWSKENLEKIILELIKTKKLSNGDVLWPLRVALTGQEKSPTPFEIAEILGKEKSLKRIKKAISII